MSVGHVARALEDTGIPTTAVYVRAFRHVAEEMKLARAVVTNSPMGRPLGPVNDQQRQRAVIVSALSLIDTATERVLADDPTPFRPVGLSQGAHERS